MVQTSWNTYVARDFSHLQYALHENSTRPDTAIILVHGITSELTHQEKFAESLQFEADVYLPILRGYDERNERGDLSYVGQYDDDLFDFIHYIKKKGYQKIILVGHSMGCANILRLLDKSKNLADHYYFLSPFFHPSLPVYKEDANNQYKPQTDIDYKVYNKRAMLLMTLHKLKIQQFSNRTVAIIPDEVHGNGQLELSFRLMASRFLEKIPSGIFNGMKQKVHTFVGTNDEVILPFELKNWYEKKFNLHLEVIEDTDHNRILHHEDVHKWLAEESIG